MNFIAIKQFSVLEARVLEDLECKNSNMCTCHHHNIFLLCVIINTAIGEWFQDNIGGDLHSESLDVVDHAQSFLTSMILHTQCVIM